MKTSAGIVPFVRPKDGGPVRFLVMRCYNNWDFPKGEYDPIRERPLTAALREFCEETGLSFVKDREFDLKLMVTSTPDGLSTHPYGKGKSQKVATFFVAEFPEEYMGKVNPPVSPELGKAEHEEVRWATFGEALDLLHPRLRRILKMAGDVIAGREPGQYDEE